MKQIWVGILILSAVFVRGRAQAANRVEFFATDEPARWFKSEAGSIAARSR